MKHPARACPSPRARLSAIVFTCAAAVAHAAPALDDADRYVAGSLEDRVDLIVRDGFDRPDAALARLTDMPEAQGPAAERLLLQARGTIEALAGRAADAGQDAEQLRALATRSGDSYAGAAASLVRALVADTAGQGDVAAALARPALDTYLAGCPGGNAPMKAERALTAPCDYRSASRALALLQRRSMSLGQAVLARGQLETMIGLADRAGDAWRKADGLGLLAFVLTTVGENAAADRTMAEAKRVAAPLADPALLARLVSSQARIARQRNQPRAAVQWLEEALALARRAHAERLEAMVLANLSDLYAKQHEAAHALHAANEALAIVRRFNDQRAERVLINNAGLAKIGLGRIAEGKQDLAHLLDLWHASASLADEAETLREFDEALSAAGDSRAALDLYHRERAVTAEAVRRAREAAVTEMQAHYDADAKQHRIELLNRDNALKSASLASRTQLLKNWAAVALVLAVSVAVAFALLRHVRRMQRTLEATEARLREQSERDALTHLANRRHLHAVMERAGSVAGDVFEGAMLLVDVDHFKSINDRYGHAAGDAVLVEMGRRLVDAVRGDDLVVRWGGEEFLIVARGLSATHAHQLAGRLLDELGGRPFDVQGQTLRITASIGYGRFPLTPSRRALPWQQGVDLVDKALYSAKSGGRNRAMGIVLASDRAPPGLQRIATNAESFAQSRPMELVQTCGSG